MGRGLFSPKRELLLGIYYYYSCPWEMSERHKMLHAQIFVSGVERYCHTVHTDIQRLLFNHIQLKILDIM